MAERGPSHCEPAYRPGLPWYEFNPGGIRSRKHINVQEAMEWLKNPKVQSPPVTVSQHKPAGSEKTEEDDDLPF